MFAPGRKLPARHRREACALWCEGKRQPCGLLREAQSDPQVRRKEACALWALAAKGGKATWRREQIQGLRAASAQNADICEDSETMSATVREARMIKQPGHLGRRPKATRAKPCDTNRTWRAAALQPSQNKFSPKRAAPEKQHPLPARPAFFNQINSSYLPFAQSWVQVCTISQGCVSARSISKAKYVSWSASTSG